MVITCRQTSYSVKAHDEVLAQWQQVQDEPGPLHLNLEQVQFVDPFGICLLILFINHLPQTALPVRLTFPGWPATQPGQPVEPSFGPVGYLTRMGFWEEVEARLDVQPRQVPVRPLDEVDRSVLLDVTIMHTHDSISVMLRKTGAILEQLNFSVLGRGHVLEVLSELSGNVLMHAQTEFGGVTAMQTYGGRSGVRYVVIGIGDAGIGVRRSLASNVELVGRLSNDEQALAVALAPGCSRFSLAGHGGGLPRVVGIAHRYGGRLSFRSGAGALVFDGQTESKQIFSVPPLTGTALRLALPEAHLRQ